MRLVRRISAAQMAMLSILGILVGACGFADFLPRYPRASWQNQAQIAANLGLVALGLTLSIKASSSLENGIAAERWPEEEIRSLRIKLKSTMLTVLSFGILFTSIMLMFVLHLHSSVALAGSVIVHGIGRLRYVVRQTGGSRPQIDWRNSLPISSEHWGSR